MPRILIVDDDSLNRELLRAKLAPLGYELTEASTGESAVEACAKQDIDLVLLDVLMPGIGGLEALKQIKAAHVGYLPIVLLTALADSASRRRGLDAGADDFLTKPFDSVELLLRLRNLLALRTDRLALQKRNDQLIELQRFKEEMTALLVHDLKNPTAVVLANLEFATNCLPSGVRNETLVEALDDARDSARRMLRLLANLLDVARAEDSRLALHRAPADLAAIVEPLVAARMVSADARGRHIEVKLERGLAAPIDADLVSRVIDNVLDNALRYTPRGGVIVVSGKREAGCIQLRIGNTGAPIPPEARTRIFEKYAQGPTDERTNVNVGLGLYFCRLATEAHGGKIWVEEAEMPTVFVVSLPEGEPLNLS